MKAPSCVVIDYGIGNVFSVLHALKSLGVNAVLTRDRAEILAADRVILPGVGAFGRAADRLRAYGLDDTIRGFVDIGRPFLGICVGMQLLMSRGNEFGVHRGLDIIPGTVEKIDITTEVGTKLRVPLIGWYPITPVKESLSGTPLEHASYDAAYYFVHSYAVQPDNPENCLASVIHQGHPVTAAVRHENAIGVQFHPERSGADGLALLNRFIAL